MSNYTEKAQLIGGGDIVYLDRAAVRSYREVQNEYSADILGTTLSFRFSNSATRVQETRSIIIDSVNIVTILQDMMEIYEIEDDATSPRFLEARIDDSRILITLIHDSYDTLEILAQEVTASDAINHLHLHPTPHPSGISQVGQVRMGASNKQNRALNAGAFLVRGEDRTSTGINRVLSKLSDNADLVEQRTRRSQRGDVQRVLPCSVAQGVVASIRATLVGGEVLTATRENYKDFPLGDSDDVYWQALFDMAKGATSPILGDDVSYDFIMGEESTDSRYVFNRTAGRTSPNARFDYSFIALSEAGRDLAVSTLSVPGSPYNQAEIDSDPDYYTVADQIGTVHGPKYRTRTANDEYVEAEVIDFFTFRFNERLPSLTFVNQGDFVILPSGVFEVDFVGHDNRTVGVRRFGGNFAEVFGLNPSTTNLISDLQMPATLTPSEKIPEVILVKSGIGVRGEYYGVGRYGHDHSPIETSRRFRIRTLVRDINTTAGDDTALRKAVHELQNVLDPYSDTSSYSITTSLRSVNAVGGVLKLPKLYSIPEDTQELYKLDYLIGSQAYGPLRVSPSQYAAVPSKLSIFSGVGGWRNAPDPGALLRTREAYYVAEYSISSEDARRKLIDYIDAALLDGDWSAAKSIETFLNELSSPVTVSGKVLPTAFRQNSREEREDVVDFFREVMQIGGRSYVYNDTPAELDAANGLTVRLTGKAFFSEADVGRVFILSLPMIAKEVQARPQQGLPLPAYSKTRQVRVRLHTWTSPKSARFMPIDGMEFHLHREFSVKISPSLGYANIGYGAFTNSIIPSEHEILATSAVDSKLTEGTEYRHISPGSVSFLDVDTPFTTSLRTYSHLYYVLGSEELGAYLPDGAPASADPRIDLFAEERSLLLVSESVITLVGEQNSFAGAHPQDGQLGLNHSNRARLQGLSQLTFLPFLRSSDQRLRVRSDDFLHYLFQNTFGATTSPTGPLYSDLVAFSPNVYQEGVTIAGAVGLQSALCASMASLRGADLTNEYTQIPVNGDLFQQILSPLLLPYISREVDGVLTPYENYDDFIVSLYGDDVVLEIDRAAGGVRAEDASLLKDIHNCNPTANTQVPLNCEDLLLHSTISSKSSLGHLRSTLHEDVYHGTKLTSNRVLLAVPSELNSESVAAVNAIENVYGGATTDTGTLVQYVGRETIDTSHPFSSPFTLEVDSNGVGRLRIEETPGTSRRVPLKTRSWFRLSTKRADGTSAGVINFTFDNQGRVRELSEYAQSGEATSSIYGAFQGLNPISGQPRWDGITWSVISSAPADATSISSVEISEATVNTFAIHSVLKSADIPYYVTAHVKSVARVAPVSKELGKTLSSVITERSGVTPAQFYGFNDIDSADAALIHAGASNRLLMSNMYPSIVRTESGRVEKVTFDSAHSSGMDINIYDGNSLTSYSRDDGIRISAFTRGYTDTLPNTSRTSRKHNTLHVLSEETISGVRITHAGIENTMFLDTLLEVTSQLQLYTPLAHAGLIVDLGSERAWSADSAIKHGVSDPNRLTSPLSSVRRTVPVNTDEGSISVPLVAAAKIESNEAIGLYVDWEGEPPTYNSEDLPLTIVDGAGTQPVIHLTTSVDNASILSRGEQDVGKSLNSSGAPLLDRDNARSALTALGPISAIGTLRVVGDLRCTFYADENIGDGYAVLAGVRGHLNPITAPRAQNYWNSLHSMAEHLIGVTEHAVSVRALAQGTFNIFPNPIYDVNSLVAGDENFRSNRNPEGKAQQQLGERHNIIKYTYLPFYPHDDTYLTVEQDPDLLSALYTEEHVVQELEPTLCTIGGGASLAAPTEVLYRPLAICLYRPSIIANDVLNGYKDEYLLFVMPRGIMSFGKAYLGRTVTLELNRLIPNNVSVPPSTTTIPSVISAVISDIEDRPDLSVTFVKFVATLNRFDTFSSTPAGLGGGPLITSGPQDLFSQVQPLYDAGLITSLNKSHFPSIVIEAITDNEFDYTWGNLWSLTKAPMSYGAGYYAFQAQSTSPLSPALGQLQVTITVHGREWVLNAYQAYISDKLRLLNDLGGEAALYLKRDNTLVMTSEQVEVYSQGDVTITATSNVGIVSTTGDIALDADEALTITAESGAIVLPNRTIPFNELATRTGYLSVIVDSYYVTSAAPDWYDTLTFYLNSVYGVHPAESGYLGVEEKFVFKANNNVVSFITVEKSDPNMPDFEAYFNLGAVPMARSLFDSDFAGANYIQSSQAWKAMCSSIAIVGPPGSVRESYRLFHPSVQMLSDDESWANNDTWGLNNRHISVERILPNLYRYSPHPTFEPVETAFRLDDMTDDTILTNRANHKYRINLPDIGSGETRTPSEQVVFEYADTDFDGQLERTDEVLDIRSSVRSDYIAPTFSVNRKRIRYALSFAVQYGGWESYERRQFSGIYQRSNRVRGYPTITNFGPDTFLVVGGGNPPEWP